MNEKLIAIDLDGTLLNKANQLSSFSCEILAKLASKGFTIILASGRPYRALAPFYQAIGLTTPLIAYNGIHVFNPTDPHFPAVKRTFSKEEVLAIAKEVGNKVTSFLCEGDKTIYLSREDAYLAHYFPYQNYPHAIGPIERNLQEDVYAMVFRSSHANLPFLKKAVEAQGRIAFRTWTSSFYSEAYYRGVDKGSGLRFLKKTLGFQSEDVYAFGDSLNDLEMLEEAGHPYAVIHCKSPLLSSKFPSTKKDNDHDGVALTLQELFL
jgi:5-amino-6-(5-phospho-D-ribitylamino)uracil phosphatase